MDGRNPSDIDRGLQILLEHISPATFHDSHQRLNDTNLTIVKKWVQKWTPRLKSSDLSSFQSQLNNPEQTIVDVFAWLFDLSSPSPIMWIHHEDRSQTSFFAHTIADILDELGKLSGSFFSSKPDGPIDLTRVIPTLAFQLARNAPITRSPIAQAVLQDLSIFDLRAKSQIKRLIVYPLSLALRSGDVAIRGIPNVFLIHGLEESDNTDQSLLSLLDAFSGALTLLRTNNIPYRLLLVGRYSSYIKKCISNPDMAQKVLERSITMPVLLREEVQDGRMEGKAANKAAELPWRLMNTLKGHTNPVNAIVFSPDGTRLASGSDDNTVRLWDGKYGRLIAIQGHSNPVRSLAFSLDGTRLASGSYPDGSVRLFEGKSGSLIAILKGTIGVVPSLTFSPDGLRLASGSYLWEGKTGNLVATLSGHDGVIRDVAFSADGSILASGSDDNTIRLWDGNTGNLITVLKGHSYTIHSLAFSPYGSRLASGSYDCTVRLWEGKTGSLIAILRHRNQVYDVAFSPDGSILASGGNESTVPLWDVETGSLISTLYGHSSAVANVAFSKHGSMLASASYDNTVRLWDVETKSHITTLEGHSSTVHAVAFSPDGSTLASASGDCTVRLWH